MFQEDGKKLFKTFQIFFKGRREPYEGWVQLVPKDGTSLQKVVERLRVSCSRFVCAIIRFIFVENVKSAGVVTYQFVSWDSVGNW